MHSLYSHRDVFLRELVSNANDALEKLRLTSLTEAQVLDGAEQLNITVKAVKDESGPGRIIVTGMHCSWECIVRSPDVGVLLQILALV